MIVYYIGAQERPQLFEEIVHQLHLVDLVGREVLLGERLRDPASKFIDAYQGMIKYLFSRS